MHVLPGLAVGGTEMVLLRLVGSTSGIKHRVVTLTVHDALRPEFEQLGVQVYTLGMSRNPFSWIRVFKLRKIIREFAPDILQSWLYAADLALMFSGVGRSTRKIWNLIQVFLWQYIKLHRDSAFKNICPRKRVQLCLCSGL